MFSDKELRDELRSYIQRAKTNLCMFQQAPKSDIYGPSLLVIHEKEFEWDQHLKQAEILLAASILYSKGLLDISMLNPSKEISRSILSFKRKLKTFFDLNKLWQRTPLELLNVIVAMERVYNLSEIFLQNGGSFYKPPVHPINTSIEIIEEHFLKLKQEIKTVARYLKKNEGRSPAEVRRSYEAEIMQEENESRYAAYKYLPGFNIQRDFL
jgi:hypothetical protein